MDNVESISKPMMWFMALLLTLISGCGGGMENTANTAVPVTAKALTAYSLAGVVGTIDETAKTIAVNMPFGTDVTALVATFTSTGANVKVGAALQTSGATANNFTVPLAYTVTAADSSTASYTVTVTVAQNFAKAITAYSLDGVVGTIDETAKTIAVNMPFGTDVTALVATFTSTGANVKVGAALQTSGATANNFTVPLAYTVTAADGSTASYTVTSTASYTVTVTVASNSAKALTAYSLAGVVGTIDETAKTIAVNMPFGTDVTALVATFTSTGANVKVGAALQTSGATANNFTVPLAYTVTAADSSTASYTVTVTVASNSAKALTAYSLAGVVGTIDETAKTIAVNMPFGTDVTALVATFTSTGANVKVGAALQTSGATANNFTVPLAYTVTAADGSTASYTVTVTVDVAAGLNLRRTTSFAILSTGSSITASGTIDVTGDVGATSFTGGGTLNITAGTDYSSGAGAAFVDAQADLPLVISDANDTALFPCGSTIAGGDLANVTLIPGVTCILSDAAISNTGVVTLNGPGEYIIRTNAALTAAAGSSVIFSGGADNTNTSVFWVVTSASFTSSAGSPVLWKGTILATTGAITLGDSATLIKGRVLTTAGVTLTNNTVTIP